MEFCKNQFYSSKNLLSYRTRVDSREVNKLLLFIENNLDSLELEKTGNIIFCIYEIIPQNTKTIFGIEVLVPVNKIFESSGQYVYKPIFRLENAVSSRICIKPEDILDTEFQFKEYLIKNNLKDITNIYYVCDTNFQKNHIADTYVAVNANSI